MKVTQLSALGLVSLLTSGTLARPRSAPEDNSPIRQRSHVTAFLFTDNGARVECWEIDNLLSDNDRQPGKDRPDDGQPRVLSMGTGERGLTGVDVITWPAGARIFPPDSNDIRSRHSDMSRNPSLITVKDGMMAVDMRDANNLDSEDQNQFYFNAQNGDDWLYIEDQTENHQRSDQDPIPLNVESVSGGDTTVIRFRHRHTPNHKVLHKGRCNFAGLQDRQEWDNDDNNNNNNRDRDGDDPIVVQEL